MQPTKYSYNRLQLIGFFCAFLPFFIFSAKEIQLDLVTGESVLSVLYALVDAVLLGTIVWFIVMGIIPANKHGAALVLDDEKLFYFMYNKIVYWKDVTGISGNNKNIVIKTADGNKTTIRTSWLKTNKDIVYDAIKSRLQ